MDDAGSGATADRLDQPWIADRGEQKTTSSGLTTSRIELTDHMGESGTEWAVTSHGVSGQRTTNR